MTPHEIRERILWYQDRYPEFPHCTLDSEVELIYGGGQALEDWRKYKGLRDLLEVGSYS